MYGRRSLPTAFGATNSDEFGATIGQEESEIIHCKVFVL
jgi:hypothetical protein